MLVLQPMPIRNFGLGLGQPMMSSKEAANTVRTMQKRMQRFATSLSPAEMSGAITITDAWVAEMIDIEVGLPPRFEVTAAQAVKFNAAVRVLLEAAQLRTGITPSQANNAGMYPRLPEGEHAGIFSDTVAEVDALVAYWNKLSPPGFPWVTTIGIVGLVGAVAGGAYVIHRQTRKRRRRRR